MSEATFYAKDRGANVSLDGKYRYELWRKWDAVLDPLTFVMLNPSTADALVDDPTIRRCIGFAKTNGFGGIRVLNLYAFRATEPKVMLREIDPIGPDNDGYLEGLSGSSTVVAAWGTNATAYRVRQVLPSLRRSSLFCLGTTKDGHPRHPLYVPASQPLVPFGSAS